MKIELKKFPERKGLPNDKVSIEVESKFIDLEIERRDRIAKRDIQIAARKRHSRRIINRECSCICKINLKRLNSISENCYTFVV